MKKILLFVVALTLTTGAFAQLSWGVKAGLNLSNISNFEADMKPSIYVGAFAEYQVSDFLGIQPELVYSRQGSKDKFSEDGVDIKAKMRLNYLNVPVLAKLYILDNLSIDLGPQFGFLLNSKSIVKTDGTTVKEDNDGLKGFDFAIAMGLSYKLGEKLDVSARYNLGLSDLAKDNDGDDKFHNGTFQIGVGYRF